jgi:hypothetical protein
MDPSNVADTVAYFQRVFTVVLALALSEGFRQFVADTRGRNARPEIYSDRLPALVIFICLILPFFHGMNRYFYGTYYGLKVREQFPNYSYFLMFDGISFMAESALFFVLSRSFPERYWQRYFRIVLVLLGVDSFWCVVSLTHGAPVQNWLFLNLVLGGVLLLTLDLDKNPRSKIGPWVGAIATLLCAGVGYIVDWKLYFPVLP